MQWQNKAGWHVGRKHILFYEIATDDDAYLNTYFSYLTELDSWRDQPLWSYAIIQKQGHFSSANVFFFF